MSSKANSILESLGLGGELRTGLRVTKLSNILEQNSGDDNTHYMTEDFLERFDGIEYAYVKYLLKKNFDEIIITEDWEFTDPNITKLPDNLTVRADLTIDLPNLEELPSGLIVEGILRIRAPHLKTLPEDIQVEKALDVIKTQVTETQFGVNEIFTQNNLKIVYDINLSDAGDFLDVGRDYRQDIFGKIFGDDYHEWYSYYDSDWKSTLNYYVDKANTKKIEEIVQSYIIKNGMDPDEPEDSSLEGLIKYYDLNDITQAINSAESEAANQAYSNSLQKEVISCFQEYGDVEVIQWDEIKLTIDLSPVITDLSDYDFGDYYKRCELDFKCWFNEMRGEVIDIPKFDPDDRYTPDIDKANYNDILSDRLSDIEI